MPRRRPINGPTPTQLLTPVMPVWYSPTTSPTINPGNVLGRNIPLLSGQPISSLAAFAPAFPAQFFNRTLPAVSSNLSANAALNIGTAQDATMRAFNSIRMRFFGMKEPGT